MDINMYVNIQSINFNIFNYRSYGTKRSDDTHFVVSNPIQMKQPLTCDVVSFSGVRHGGDVLRKLSEYNITDMYTGLKLLDPKILERMQTNGTFNLPASKLMKIISNYEDTMMPINKEVFGIFKKAAQKHPDMTLSELIQELYPKHKKQLLRDQQYIFQKIIRLACDLPKNLFEEFSELMNITNKRLSNDPVVLPFSEREFLYKLRRIGEEMRTKNNRNEMHAMHQLYSIANKIFNNEPKGKRAYGRNIKKKLEIQMQPEILKRNSSNLDKFQKIFNVSTLKNNEDIIRLLDSTSAKVHGFPSFANFERKSFIHELKKITRKLKNRKLAQEFSEAAISLPTSKDNISAFIVKFSDQNNNKIGTNILYSGMCTIDHLVAKKNGGPNRLSNYGLSGARINQEKTNIYFDEWVRMHPETRKNCQKYVDRLIELYKEGVFAKISKNQKSKRIDKSYIEDFVKTIYDISPKENRIVLDISKLYE